MIPTLLASGIILYGIIQFIVALIAVFLAIRWNRKEFLPGLFFLTLYAIIEVINLFFFMILSNIFIDVAQFGFILIAIIFFIIGMHPSYTKKNVPHETEQITDKKPSGKESVISLLKKI